jgi:hypothetical protein
MSTGVKLTSLLIVALLCVSSLAGETAHAQRKAKKPVLPPPLPSGPQGPVPQVPLDSIPAVAPQVIYESGQLTILAPNSTLADILRAVRKQTSADIDIPAGANERVVTSLGPGSAREVVAELLNGSRFNYVLLGSPSDASRLTRVVLVAKTGPDVAGQPAQPQEQSPMVGPMSSVSSPPPMEMNNPPEAQDAEATDENSTDDNADQNAAEAEQQAAPPEQPGGIKTPQQMLQEMQQRQMQMQQQIQGQPPIPGAAMPPPQPHPQPQQPQEP